MNNKTLEEVFRNAVNELKNYLEKNNLQSMVLGISGGLDSTVVAAICHEVSKQTGKEFIGVSLPSGTNSSKENSSADCTQRAFCDRIITIDIDDLYGLTSYKCKKPFGETTNIAEGNLKARLRMTILYHIAQLNKGIVMDTDNMTENMLGFFTIHGDVGDFSPIYSLWKHEVFELAEYLAEKYYNDYTSKKDIDTDLILRELSMRKAVQLVPTDGNGVTRGGDMDQIAPGSNYNIVDDILKTLLESDNNETKKLLYEKYDKDTVDRVWNRHLNTEFKRKNLPIRLKRNDLFKG